MQFEIEISNGNQLYSSRNQLILPGLTDVYYHYVSTSGPFGEDHPHDIKLHTTVHNYNPNLAVFVIQREGTELNKIAFRLQVYVLKATTFGAGEHIAEVNFIKPKGCGDGKRSVDTTVVEPNEPVNKRARTPSPAPVDQDLPEPKPEPESAAEPGPELPDMPTDDAQLEHEPEPDPKPEPEPESDSREPVPAAPVVAPVDGHVDESPQLVEV
uniref:Uncharacterized protein n=1 Tax=Culex nigripalpus nucleopolyhedrovirus TaxID=130556 RepID=Q99GP7_NPVCN|nr:unknown [Culex nigripalpus nucleopolyhedrovirus]